MTDTFTIQVGGDVFCPTCQRGEVEDNTLPVSEWRWNIRPNKVENKGVWWHNCLHCKTWFDDHGHVEVGEQTDPVIRKEYGLDKLGLYKFEW